MTTVQDDSPNIQPQAPENTPWQPRNGPVHCCCTLFAANASFVRTRGYRQR